MHFLGTSATGNTSVASTTSAEAADTGWSVLLAVQVSALSSHGALIDVLVTATERHNTHNIQTYM